MKEELKAYDVDIECMDCSNSKFYIEVRDIKDEEGKTGKWVAMCSKCEAEWEIT